MNSSTSSSELRVSGRRWAGFAMAFLASVALGAASLLALAALLDPYDTGRTLFDLKPGLRPQGPRTANASRGRDPAYEAAIIGNSHIQLISPAELTAGTGSRFASLATPGIGPKESLALIDWFLRHRREPARALVIGIDESWCTDNAALPNARPFPFWLYERSLPAYLVGLLRLDVVEELPRRIVYLRDRDAPRARPDGYWNYEPDFGPQGPEQEAKRRSLLAQRIAIGGGNAGGSFPAAFALEAALARAPGMALILVRPPTFVTALPTPGSPDAAADAACRAAFAGLAARRPRSVLIDWRVDRPENRDPALFFDHTHYRRPLAALVEADIAAAMSRLR